MQDKMAVFVTREGMTASLYETVCIVIYEKAGGEWQESRRGEYGFENSMGIKELRWKMQKIIEFLDDCRLVAAKSIAGVPYFELEKARISVCEISGRAEDVLEVVWQAEQNNLAMAGLHIDTPAPQLLETFPGCFRISLKEIQSNQVFLSSKQVLQPILQKGDFNTLEVICSHVPPWLELALAGDQYQSYVERSQQESRIIIENKANPIPIAEN